MSPPSDEPGDKAAPVEPIEPDMDARPLAPGAAAAPAPAPDRARAVWVNSTYFAEGLPLMIVLRLSSVFFTDVGAKLSSIGYLNALGFPWNFKFVWAPLVDLLGTKRRWLVGVQVLIGLLTIGIGVLCSTAAGGGDVMGTLRPIALVLVVTAFAAATNDISIDSFYMDAIPDLRQQAAYSGYRVMAYRVAIIFATFGLVWISTLWADKALAWAFAFGAAGLVMLLLAAFHAWYLPHPPAVPRSLASTYAEELDRPRPGFRPLLPGLRTGAENTLVQFAWPLALVVSLIWADWRSVGVTENVLRILGQTVAGGLAGGYLLVLLLRALPPGGRYAFLSYLQQEKVGLMLLFIVTYKVGDEILFSMNTPFLMRELGVTKAQYSWLAGFVGAGTTVVGAMIGAKWIERTGLRRAIWPLTLLMNLNIWAYVWLAWAKPDPTTAAGITVIAVVHGYEQIAAALGNAVLLVYLLGTCKPEFRAAHYAIGSALMSIPSRVVGTFGGVLVERLGYLYFYELAFLVTLPAMALMFFVPIKGDTGPAAKKAAAGS